MELCQPVTHSGDHSHTRDAVAGFEIHDSHAHRVATLCGYLLDSGAHNLSALAHHNEVVARGDSFHRGDTAVPPAGVDIDQPLSVPRLPAVLRERRPLAVAVSRDRQQGALVGVVCRDHTGHPVTVLQVDRTDTAGVAPHLADLALGEPDRHAVLRGDHQVTRPVGYLDVDERVVIVDCCGDEPRRPDVLEVGRAGALYVPLPRDHRQTLVTVEGVGVDHRRYLLTVVQVDDVDRGFPARVPRHLGDLVGLHPVDLPLIGETQQVVVGVRHEHRRDAVALLRVGTDYPLSAPALRVELRRRHPFYVVLLGQHHQTVLLGDEVLVGHLALGLHDAGPAVVAVLRLEFAQFVGDDPEQFLLAREHGLQVLDAFLDLLVLGPYLVGLHRGERADLHPEDVHRLWLREAKRGLHDRVLEVDILDITRVERPLEHRLCLVTVCGLRDHVDDCLGPLDGLEAALQDVCPVLGLLQVVL